MISGVEQHGVSSLSRRTNAAIEAKRVVTIQHAVSEVLDATVLEYQSLTSQSSIYECVINIEILQWKEADHSNGPENLFSVFSSNFHFSRVPHY